MINIALVDDDYRIIAGLTNILRKYYKKDEYHQEDYSNGMEFVKDLNNHRFDIVFMDLEMDIMNGEEASKRLREIDKNENTYIIYVSSHTDNLVGLFSVHPFDFIEKPVEESKVIDVLNKINADKNNKKKIISLVSNRKKIHIPVNNIVFIQSVGHRLKINMAGQKEELICYMKIDLLQKEIEEVSGDFYRIHASFLVNRNYIKKYTKGSVFIDNQEIPISKKYRLQVTEKILDGMME